SALTVPYRLRSLPIPHCTQHTAHSTPIHNPQISIWKPGICTFCPLFPELFSFLKSKYLLTNSLNVFLVNDLWVSSGTALLCAEVKQTEEQQIYQTINFGLVLALFIFALVGLKTKY